MHHILYVSRLRVKDRSKRKIHLRKGHEGPKGKYRYSCTLSLTSALEGVGWSRPCPHRFTPGKETLYTLYRRLDGCQGRSEQMRKISPPTGIRSPDRPACSDSLYRMSYPAHTKIRDRYKFPLSFPITVICLF
jgi:hypothetical protein